MRDRVLQLEAAIAHYKVPTGTTSTVADETAGDAGESTAEICHLFGTLTIGEVETFMGPNAGSDVRHISTVKPVFIESIIPPVSSLPQTPARHHQTWALLPLPICREHALSY